MKLTPVRAAAPAVLLLALALAGCSGGGGGDAGSSADSGSGGSRTTDGVVAAERPTAPDGGAGSLSQVATGVRHTGPEEPGPVATERALIRTGNVALRSTDVGKAQFEVQRVVDRYAGEVTEEKTTTDEDGQPAYTRMVLRIPSERFDAAMAALKGVAELESARTSEDDVTTQLIDTRTRLRVQQRSIDRITTLFGRAQSIRDIMAIEAQLSRRQATLESLQRQAAYLTNQTTLSTITVSIDEVAARTTPKKDSDAGFVSGVKAGWGGLTATAAALATVLGALLPWLVVLLLLGPPVLLVYRAVRRRVSAGRSGRTPSAA